MSKFGIEVEGRLAGLPTVFCNADADLTRVLAQAVECGVGHVYISDPDNKLSYANVAHLFQTKVVTMDVTRRRSEDLPSNVTIMLRLPDWLFDQIVSLRPGDQIKSEKDRHVRVWTVGSAVVTKPEDFEGDVEL